MHVEVRLFATLRNQRFDNRVIELRDGATVSDALGQLNIPESAATLRLLAGRCATLDQKLADGDVLSLFPPLGGG